MKLWLSLGLFLCACSSYRPFVAKKRLVDPWSFELAAKVLMKEPYVAVYERGARRLVYVAALHEYGPSSNTFKTIHSAFNHYQPDLIMVEGIADLGAARQKRILHLAKKCHKENFSRCGENLYAVYLAKQKKIPWISGEPSESVIHAKLQGNGYTLADISFFYLVRQIRQLRREEGLNESNFDKVAQETLDRQAKADGLPNGLTAQDFKNWYKEKMGIPFNLAEIDSETVAPTVSDNMTFLNHISAGIGKIRDEYIVELIAHQLNKNLMVMVIYGGSHHMTQYRALKDMLGKPQVIKFF